MPIYHLSYCVKSVNSERRVLSLAHGITAAARPKSFISPILLAISLYVNTKLESRELVDILSSLSFADDYKEVLRLSDALLPTQEKDYDWEGALVNFALDNADINTRTLTGHNTWHALGGIASKTPAGEHVEATIQRSTKIRSATDAGMFGEIALKHYRKPAIPGLKNVLIQPLFPSDYRPRGLETAIRLDTIWLSSYYVTDLGKCPSWSGFNQTVCKGYFEMSKVDIIPFVNHNPTQPDTLYSALAFIQSATEKYKLGAVPVTFDQPLYIKASEIVASSPELSNIFLRLGGFHLVMSYLGSVGYIMSQSGLKDMWETVYANNSIEHMMTGHAYARALRAHMLTAASLVGHLLERNGLNDELKNSLNQIHEKLQNDTYTVESLEEDDAVTQMCQLIDDLQDEVGEKSRTGKLWMEYVKMIRVLLQFIRAERCGDWDMHLYCVAQMIPVLHAGGHTAYAKSTRLYLDEMRRLPTRMDADTFKKYTTGGYWTIRRSNRFWSGNFTDQSIETILMRMLKSRGGVAHGRGVSPSTLAKMVHIIPQTVPICQSLEKFSGVYSNTNDQHKDLRPSSITRDCLHYSRFSDFIAHHSPLDYTGDHKDKLVCIATGIVAPLSANPDCAFQLGKTAANTLCGQNYADVKLKRSDRVISIGAASDSVAIRGKEVEIDPMSLFLRVTFTINNPTDLKDHLAYEFSKYPPSMFLNGMMRKTAKNALANTLKKYSRPISGDILLNSIFVIDGGHLLHQLDWQNDCTYGDVIASYTDYVFKWYGAFSFVCFDGYEEKTMSTKWAEQTRRAGKNTASDVIFDLEMKVTNSRDSFLANKNNTTRLISYLMTSLSTNCIVSKQAKGDADYLICNTAITLAKEYNDRSVVVVGNDTDLLVILIEKSLPNLHLQFQRDAVYNVQSIKDKLDVSVSAHLLVAHAITGCDTVSAMHNIGKRAPMRELKSHDCRFLEVFKSEDASHEEIARAGEEFILKLYRAKKASKTLDDWRHISYSRVMKSRKKAKSAKFTHFHLSNLPPTSAAAKYHSYRAYYTVQQWLGRSLLPTEWGWQCSDGVLIPTLSDKPVASKSILCMVSCGCKTGCGKKCSCRKAGLECKAMCSACMGRSCTNSSQIDD